MRAIVSTLAIVLLTAMPSLAAPGDQWVLGIHHFDHGTGDFIPSIGGGYAGPHSSGDPQYFGNSYSHAGTSGDISRVYWELSGRALLPENYPGDYNHDRRVDSADYVEWRRTNIDGQAGYDTWREHFGDTGPEVPTTTELYRIEYYQTAQPNGRDDYAVIESRFHGQGHPDHGGEAFPIDDHIPWQGAFGSNHQWISLAASIEPGEWNTTGPGPNVPASPAFNAPPFGEYMWLTDESWLYAKWDFPYQTNRAWSALRLTQVTENGQLVSGSGGGPEAGVPEPTTAVAAMIALVGAGLFRSRRRAGASADA